ncbi:MAG: sugar isomerase, partial [Bacteroidota bacterium]
ILQDAFRTDLRPLIREARLQAGGALEPIAAYRHFQVRKALIDERGSQGQATGL